MKNALFLLLGIVLIACDDDVLVCKEDIDHVNIIAHRGITLYAPENGLRAIAMAVNMGVNAVEFDIQLTKDGELVIFHDNDLLKRTGKKGRICDFTVQELKELRLIDKLGNTTDEEIPTLIEVLNQIGSQIYCFIELKFSSLRMEEKLVELLDKYDLNSSVTVLSFDNSALVRLHSLNKSLPLCLLLYDNTLAPINSAYQMDCSHLTGLGLHYSLCRGNLLENLKKKSGIKDIYIYTVNSLEDISRDHFKWIDGIITDNPEKWLSLRSDWP